ncbi:uncharacterized protein PGTG_16762 [Puccinia graminis f. sp. tritici CRL 75-36-700-3]|uniref:Uncharacterized protein n=2 Tax=Puccinia graminis f. sp. tritici TaxID=56615 RepID=E3L2E9_PUCGT|nr:uncharacterized protein PGTG_16762 [Puccinia graminis f. sp. tritici CRL 75-36-700-3]EFP90736.2 hypothetical protein PGTG_16762 [Puccinia graminis f. sp. tritici CRL 75-36-700-3]
MDLFTQLRATRVERKFPFPCGVYSLLSHYADRSLATLLYWDNGIPRDSGLDYAEPEYSLVTLAVPRLASTADGPV